MEEVEKDKAFDFFKDNKPNMGDLIYLLRKCNKKLYNQCHINNLRYHLIDQRANIFGMDLLSIHHFILPDILDELMENDIDIELLHKEAKISI